jgi:hypothetical protein
MRSGLLPATAAIFQLTYDVFFTFTIRSLQLNSNVPSTNWLSRPLHFNSPLTHSSLPYKPSVEQRKLTLLPCYINAMFTGVAEQRY